MANFYNKRKEIYSKHPDLSITLFIKFWMVLATIMILLCLVASTFLIIQQVFYIYNDLPYYDLTKNKNKEQHYGLCVMDSITKEYNAFNKGCLANFYYIVGPSILHFFFPIPKYNESFDILENKQVFKKVNKPHPFQVHNFLKSIEYPDFEETWAEQVKTMEPDNFLELSENSYGNKQII